MNKIANMLLFAVVALCMRAGKISAQMPAAIDAPGQTLVATLHAEGAQVYECKADTEGKLTWQIREPIATLFLDGKTIGRHYVGPTGSTRTAVCLSVRWLGSCSAQRLTTSRG